MNQAGKQLVVNTIVIGKFLGLKKQLINYVICDCRTYIFPS